MPTTLAMNFDMACLLTFPLPTPHSPLLTYLTLAQQHAE